MGDWCLGDNSSREQAADRYLSLVNGLASTGEALRTRNALQGTRAEALPAAMRNVLTNACDEQLEDHVQTQSVSTSQISVGSGEKKRKAKKRKETEVEDLEKIEEDGEGEGDIEKVIVDKVTPSGKDSGWASNAAAWMHTLQEDVHSTHFKVLQNLLIYIFSFDAVQDAAALAEQTRANARTMQVAAAVGMVKKTSNTTLSDLSKAISRLLLTEAAVNVVEFQSLVMHGSTAQLLTEFVDSILNGTPPLVTGSLNRCHFYLSPQGEGLYR
jgi:hypothetical protein